MTQNVYENTESVKFKFQKKSILRLFRSMVRLYTFMGKWPERGILIPLYARTNVKL